MQIFRDQLPNYPTAASFFEDMVLEMLVPDAAGERLLPQDLVGLMPEPYLSLHSRTAEQLLARVVEAARLDQVGGCWAGGGHDCAVGCWIGLASVQR